MSELKPITVNTAPEEEPHIYAEDDAAILQSMFGLDGVASVGKKCAATVLSSNKVRIDNGVVIVGGHFARIPYGKYVDLDIESESPGKKRNDIIAVRFETTGTGGVDTMEFVVLQGESGTTATDPTVTKEDLYSGGKVREFPLYRIVIEGANITAAEPMFTVLKDKETLQKTLEKFKNYTPMLPSSTYSGDLDELDTGVYMVNIANSKHVPKYFTSNYARTLVWGRSMQILIGYATAGSQVMAVRVFGNDAWTEWRTIGFGHAFGDARMTDTLTDALSVSTTSPNSLSNITGFVNSDTKNKPDNCSWGIREVSWITESVIIVRITGRTTGGSKAVWINTHNDDGWTGWDVIMPNANTIRQNNVTRTKLGVTSVKVTKATSAPLFSISEINKLLGVTNVSGTNTLISVGNADGSVNGACIKGVNFMLLNGSVKNTWYALFDQETSGTVKIMYRIDYCGSE